MSSNTATEVCLVCVWWIFIVFILWSLAQSCGKQPKGMKNPVPTLPSTQPSKSQNVSEEKSATSKFKLTEPLTRPSQPSTSSNVTQFKEDKTYYFKDVIFLVEETFFKVPRHHFERDSQIFSTIFSLPTGESAPPEGNSKDRPLRLDGIKKDDFLPLLKVICPKHFLRREELADAEWFSVLKLSTMWELEDARNLAIYTLTPRALDPLTQLSLSMEYHVPQWFLPSITALLVQEKPIDEKYIIHLGLHFSLRFVEARGHIAGFKRARGDIPSGAISTFIKEFFAEEVKDLPMC